MVTRSNGSIHHDATQCTFAFFIRVAVMLLLSTPSSDENPLDSIRNRNPLPERELV
jgi:hypothetical protein